MNPKKEKIIDKIKLLLGMIIYFPFITLNLIYKFFEMSICVSHYCKQRKLDIKRGVIG